MSNPTFFPEGSSPRAADMQWRILQKMLGAILDGGTGGGGGGNSSGVGSPEGVVDAETGDLYTTDDGQLWRKTGSGTTGWFQLLGLVFMLWISLGQAAAPPPLIRNILTTNHTTLGSNITMSVGGVLNVTIPASTNSGTGDVVGPSASTDNAITRFDSTTGKLIQNSVGLLSDVGALTAIESITISNAVSAGSFTSTGTGNGYLTLWDNAGTHNVNLIGATSITTNLNWIFPAAPNTGLLLGTLSGRTNETISFSSGATTEILVGGGANTAPVWTTASGTGAPARVGAPVFTGDPTVPNVVLTDSDLTIANTAFCKSNIAAVVAGTLGQFASTTSSALAGNLSDETGTGFAVFSQNGQRNLTISPGGADDTWAGNSFSGLNNTGGVTQWDAVYLNGSSQWVLADANGSGTYPARGLATATVSTGAATTVIEDGVVRNDAWTWTPGGTIYLSVTAGGLTQTPPATTGDKIQVIGYAIDADTMRVKISSDYGTAP